MNSYTVDEQYNFSFVNIMLVHVCMVVEHESSFVLLVFHDLSQLNLKSCMAGKHCFSGSKELDPKWCK